MGALPFREIWLVDFEFSASDGERPVVRCMVAREFYTGRTHRLWLDGETVGAPPFDVGPGALFVAFFSTAEMGCFLALGWDMPVHVLDLYVEFKWYICGRDGEPNKPSLVYALDWFGLESLDIAEKTEMRELAIRGCDNDQERRDLVDYCESDVLALARLLPLMLERIDLPRALLRGDSMKAFAQVEHNGIPVDSTTLAMLSEHWESLQNDMVREVDADYGVYDGIHFRQNRFAAWLAKHGIPWEKLPSGELALDTDTFRDMSQVFPILQPLHQLRQTMDILHLSDLPVGRDSRNRCLLSPFGTITGRCAPSTTKFLFNRPAWMRSLARPEEGEAFAYIDWSSQEHGVGAVLSGDQAMIADYEAGDPYLGFGRRIGMVPQDATKHSHKAERKIIKALVLGTNYGMGEQSLAIRIGKPVVYARELLRAHRATYKKFWAWSDAAINVALFNGKVWTRFGWQTWARHKKPTVKESGDPNVRSLANFPCQGNAGDMLRLALIEMCKVVKVDASVHDAVLVEAKNEDIEAAVEQAQEAMGKASELVLYGFRLRTDAEIIRWPDRYRDDRGAEFFDLMTDRLRERRGVYEQQKARAFW